MKQYIFTLTILFLSFQFNAQVQGPPPPAGYFPIYSCDENFDGISVFDLTSFNPFLNGEDPSDYLDVEYYLSTGGNNPIDNPQAYVNKEQAQPVYIIVNPIDPAKNEIIHKNLKLYAWWFDNPISEIVACSEDEQIDLSSLSGDFLCNVDLLNEINVSFYKTYNDVVNKTNAVNFSSSDMIYVRGDSKTSDEFQIDSFDLVVKQSPKIIQPSDYLVCDDNDDGVYEFDLSTKTEEIIEGETDVSVTYHNTRIDAENRVNVLPNMYSNVTNPELVYVRIENNITSCYEIVTFNLNVVEQPCKDIGVSIIPYISPRPGFSYATYLLIRNLGLKTVTSGSVEFVKDDKVIFTSVNGVDTGNSIINTSTGFILNFNDLQPGDAEYVKVNMSVPVSVNLGDLITSRVTYSINDLDLENNTSTLTETVVGSYDPNDIMESHGSEILYDDFSSEDYLYYTIRFQNVGTADAINISIDNTLDSGLDKSTIQVLSASHDYMFTQVDNQLNWKFDDIHLPSEDIDEPNSHGFVYYKIKPIAGYTVGDVIPNTAEIYFDFNEAVITNTFETEFITTLSNKQSNQVEFSIPNPVKDVVELNFDRPVNTIEVKIYDIHGKLIQTDELSKHNSLKINVSNLKNGLYFLKVKNESFESIKKLVVVN